MAAITIDAKNALAVPQTAGLVPYGKMSLSSGWWRDIPWIDLHTAHIQNAYLKPLLEAPTVNRVRLRLVLKSLPFWFENLLFTYNVFRKLQSQGMTLDQLVDGGEELYTHVQQQLERRQGILSAETRENIDFACFTQVQMLTNYVELSEHGPVQPVRTAPSLKEVLGLYRLNAEIGLCFQACVLALEEPGIGPHPLVLGELARRAAEASQELLGFLVEFGFWALD